VSTRLSWGDRDWADTAVPPPDTALVVDSFLVDDAQVRDLARHEWRFRCSCAAMGLVVDAARLAGFLAAARRAVPSRHRWFPRLEAHPGCPAGLVLWLRPAPPITSEVRLRIEDEPDPRHHPRVKGPDLALLARLRERAAEHGADDMVLLAQDGSVVEAAHSALLWWRANTLYRPDPMLPALPSVTARRVLVQAQSEGVAIVTQRCRPPALADAEVWAVNALHGVRPVVGWQAPGLPERPPPPEPGRLARYSAMTGSTIQPTDTD
jgi:branched-subunit amino acid aminotransferase/4-amino-4-deoxychorismate lyase